MFSVALVSPKEEEYFWSGRTFTAWQMSGKVRKCGEAGSSYKGDLLAAKPDIKNDGTESGRKHMLISVHCGVDGFGMG